MTIECVECQQHGGNHHSVRHEGESLRHVSPLSQNTSSKQMPTPRRERMPVVPSWAPRRGSPSRRKTSRRALLYTRPRCSGSRSMSGKCACPFLSPACQLWVIWVSGWVHADADGCAFSLSAHILCCAQLCSSRHAVSFPAHSLLELLLPHFLSRRGRRLICCCRPAASRGGTTSAWPLSLTLLRPAAPLQPICNMCGQDLIHR